MYCVSLYFPIRPRDQLDSQSLLLFAPIISSFDQVLDSGNKSSPTPTPRRQGLGEGGRDESERIVLKIKSKKIAYFGTAGFGGSEEYFKKLFERVKINIDSSNKILGYFYCQGKMPMQVKTRYEKMLEENPEDSRLKLSIENFDRALSHPNDEDINNVKNWVDTKILNN